jgi:hypothetical protein
MEAQLLTFLRYGRDFDPNAVSLRAFSILAALGKIIFRRAIGPRAVVY